jgi:hypothetical protein
MDSKRARKSNFPSAECAFILQLAEENLEIIREKFSSTITNKRKHAVWQNICEKINALGVAKRSATDIKEKWRVMRNEARKDLSREKSSLGKTGGGKAPAPVKPTNQRIISLFGDEPGFSGIQGGIESSKWLVMRKKYIIKLRANFTSFICKSYAYRSLQLYSLVALLNTLHCLL